MPSTHPHRSRAVRAWRRTRTWLLHHVPEVEARLRPGASEASLRALEAQLGRPLPPAWLDLLRENDGPSTDHHPGLFGGWTFLSTEQIAREWRCWEDIRRRASPRLLFGSGSASSVDRPEAIDEVYTNAGWLPVAKEPLEGNYVGLDLAPGPAGRPGQIINFGRDEANKYVLCPGLDELLEWLAERCEAGEIHVARAPGLVALSCRGERLSTALIDARA